MASLKNCELGLRWGSCPVEAPSIVMFRLSPKPPNPQAYSSVFEVPVIRVRKQGGHKGVPFLKRPFDPAFGGFGELATLSPKRENAINDRWRLYRHIAGPYLG